MYRPFDLLQWVLECILQPVISVAESRKVNHLSIVLFFCYSAWPVNVFYCNVVQFIDTVN